MALPSRSDAVQVQLLGRAILLPLAVPAECTRIDGQRVVVRHNFCLVAARPQDSVPEQRLADQVHAAHKLAHVALRIVVVVVRTGQPDDHVPFRAGLVKHRAAARLPASLVRKRGALIHERIAVHNSKVWCLRAVVAVVPGFADATQDSTVAGAMAHAVVRTVWGVFAQAECIVNCLRRAHLHVVPTRPQLNRTVR